MLNWWVTPEWVEDQFCPYKMNSGSFSWTRVMDLILFCHLSFLYRAWEKGEIPWMWKNGRCLQAPKDPRMLHPACGMQKSEQTLLSSLASGPPWLLRAAWQPHACWPLWNKPITNHMHPASGLSEGTVELGEGRGVWDWSSELGTHC